MTGKRKRNNYLTYGQKYEVVKKIKEGETKENIMRDFNISHGTYWRLFENRVQILEEFGNPNNCEKLSRKTSKTSDNKELDSAVITWFQQVRDRGEPISGPILQEKALILSRKLDPSSTFKASDGWLNKFKRRYGIRSLEMKGEKLSNDRQSAEEFSKYLQEKIIQENLSLNNVYNADESGIFWKTLITTTLAQRTETEVSGRKENKDRITGLFCANASGNHRIPLLLIGKAKAPRSLKNLITPEMKNKLLKTFDSLGVIYSHQSSSWMSREIFMLWYKNIFIPSVLDHQKKTGVGGKVLLILDNAPSHPSLDDLNSVNDNFKVEYLPPNVTAIIQPMDQGLISLTKKHYKKSLLKRALFFSETVQDYIKNFNLEECFNILSKAWNSLNSSTLHKVWRSILGDSMINNENCRLSIDSNSDLENLESLTTLTEESVTFLDEFKDQICKLFSDSDITVEDSRKHLLNWLTEPEIEDCGWECLSDDDIVIFVTSGKVVAALVCEKKNMRALRMFKQRIFLQ